MNPKIIRKPISNFKIKIKRSWRSDEKLSPLCNSRMLFRYHEVTEISNCENFLLSDERGMMALCFLQLELNYVVFYSLFLSTGMYLHILSPPTPTFSLVIFIFSNVTKAQCWPMRIISKNIERFIFFNTLLRFRFFGKFGTCADIFMILLF